MTLEAFLLQLRHNPGHIEFEAIMALIDELYDFQPVPFHNGALFNKAGQNTGSCKVFAFAQLNKLTEQQTLACFGRYYREDVLENPAAGTHLNIRNFMKTGWDAVSFEGVALTPKTG